MNLIFHCFIEKLNPNFCKILHNKGNKLIYGRQFYYMKTLRQNF